MMIAQSLYVASVLRCIEGSPNTESHGLAHAPCPRAGGSSPYHILMVLKVDVTGGDGVRKLHAARRVGVAQC